MADDGRLDVDMHLNTDPAQRELESMLGRLSGMGRIADIRPVPISEQIARENFARLNRPPPSAAETFFATHAASFATGQYGGMGNVLNAFGRDMGALGSRIGSAAGSAWNAFGTARAAAGTAIGNVGAAAWNWMSTAPERMAESRRRRALMSEGFYGRGLDERVRSSGEFKRAESIAEGSGDRDLSKLLNGTNRFFSAVQRETARHNRLIADLQSKGLTDQAEIIKKHLESVRAQARNARSMGPEAMGRFADKMDQSAYGNDPLGIFGKKIGGRLGGAIAKHKGSFAALGSAIALAAELNMVARQEEVEWSNINLNNARVAGADNFAIEREKRLNEAKLAGEKKWASTGSRYGAGVGAVIGSLFGGPAGAVIGGLAGGAIGTGVGWIGGKLWGGDYEASKEDAKLQQERQFRRDMRNYNQRAAEADIKFRAGEEQREFAFRQRMMRTGYSGRQSLLDEQIAELEYGQSGKLKNHAQQAAHRAQIKKQLGTKDGVKDTSVYSMTVAINELEAMDQGESQEANKYREILKQRQAQIASLKNEKERLQTENPLTYLNGRQVGDAMSAQGMGRGAQVDVQSVNRDILAELRKANIKFDQIREQNQIGARGPTIHVSAPSIHSEF